MENISKKIFCKDSGRYFGYVLDVCIDFERFEKVGYYVVEEESENEYFLPVEKAFLFSSFVLVQSEADFEFVSNKKTSLFGKVVLSLKGDNFGSIDKLKFCGRRLISISTERAELPVKFMQFVGEEVVFVFDKKKKQKWAVERKRTEEIVVSVQSKKNEFLIVPEKVSLSPDFYVGKTCSRDIFGYNNERLLSKGDIISMSMFVKAKMHNKLNELFFAIENKK